MLVAIKKGLNVIKLIVKQCTTKFLTYHAAIASFLQTITKSKKDPVVNRVFRIIFSKRCCSR